MSQPRLTAVSLWHSIATYSCASRLIGIVLLFSAFLKGQLLSSDEFYEYAFWNSRPFLVALVLFEVGVGLWLIFGLYHKWSRLATIALFSVFIAFHLMLAVHGESSCPCFGRYSVNSWLMAGIIYSFMLLLVVLPADRNEPENNSPARLFSFAVLFVLVAVPAFMRMVYYVPVGVAFNVRGDRRLGYLVSLDLKSPTTDEILQTLTKQLGLTLAADQNLNQNPPDYGRFGPTTVKGWAALEFVAQRQLVRARWEKVENGYRLSAPVGASWTPWLVSLGLGAGIFIGNRVYAWAFKERCRGCPTSSSLQGGQNVPVKKGVRNDLPK